LPPDLEFIDESPEDAGDFDDDVLSGRRGRVPRWFVALVVAAVAAIAVVVVVQGQPDQKRRIAVPVVTPSPAHKPSAIELTLAAIYQRARDVVPAQDVLRGGSSSGSCKLVQVGSSPQRAASVALQQRLPGYRIVDTSRIIDQTAGLCALQVRARDEAGNVALIMVTSPSLGPTLGRHQMLEAHAGPFNDTFVEYAQFTTRDGWTVIVGTSGVKTRQPSTTVLGELASSPALRW
jgi:hypothetical protein